MKNKSAVGLFYIAPVFMLFLTGWLPWSGFNPGANPTVNDGALRGITLQKTDESRSQQTVNFLQQAYVKASNTNAEDYFGSSMAIDGDTLVIGAIGEDSNATWINTDQNKNDAAYAGAVYIFVRNGSTWQQQAYLKASNTDPLDYFGKAVAISGDTLVVGANHEASNAAGVNGDEQNNDLEGAGAVYIFVRNGSTWQQQAYLKASNPGENDKFGSSVAISGDTVIVGATGEDSNATGINGNQDDNSASESGAVYVFTRSGSTWQQQAYLKASNTGLMDYFGSDVAIDGNTMLVGAPSEDSNATGVNGNQTNNNAIDSGAAYVFYRTGSTWQQQAYLKASNTASADFFAYSVDISGDGIVIGAYQEDSNATGVNGNQTNNNSTDSGAAYVFIRINSAWQQIAYLKASNTGDLDGFGTSVAIDGSTIVVGANREDSNATGVNGDQNNDNKSYSGAAYVFVRVDSNWVQKAYLKASNTGGFDYFGRAVDVANDTIVVASDDEDSDATGVDGDQFNNNASKAGAAYVFAYFDRLFIPLLVR